MTFHKNWSKGEGGEARTEFYRTWRTNIGVGAVCDVDQIEYRYINGEIIPVAVIEIGVADYGPPPGLLDESHPNSFPARLNPRRGQGALLRLVAEKLNVCFYGVLLLKDQTEQFHCWNFTKGRYRMMTTQEYVNWLGSLK